MNTDTPASPQDLAAVRRAALARRDYVHVLALALEQRAKLSCIMMGEHERDLFGAAAAELRALIEPVSE